jgi:hypothetical protein
MRFHFYSVLLWRCQNLEFENGGPPVLPFRCAGRARRSVRARTACGVLTAPASERYLECYCACRRHQGLPLQGNGDFGTSAFFGSSRTSRCLLVSAHMGCGAQSAMASRKLNLTQVFINSTQKSIARFA